jgi:hypothetical protein
VDFSNAIVAGIPLVLVVIGLVEWLKRFGIQGAALNVASLLIGLAAGIAYQISIAMPADFSGWFAAGIYGLALGLVASGLYDAGKSIASGGGVG